MNARLLFGVFISIAALTFSATSAPTDVEDKETIVKELTRRTGASTVELRALEIRAKLYEPQVIYILDRTQVDIDFSEEDLRFGAKILDPILENEF